MYPFNFDAEIALQIAMDYLDRTGLIYAPIWLPPIFCARSCSEKPIRLRRPP
jgi:hypothetical protein